MIKKSHTHAHREEAPTYKIEMGFCLKLPKIYENVYYKIDINLGTLTEYIHAHTHTHEHNGKR